MFNKKTSYEVNVQDITFWRKKINVDNTEVFVRECLMILLCFIWIR